MKCKECGKEFDAELMKENGMCYRCFPIWRGQQQTRSDGLYEHSLKRHECFQKGVEYCIDVEDEWERQNHPWKCRPR